MQQPECEDERSAERPREGEDVGMVDLGDVKIETKQYNPFGYRIDNAFEMGWA
jgi:hypothetical protein